MGPREKINQITLDVGSLIVMIKLNNFGINVGLYIWACIGFKVWSYLLLFSECQAGVLLENTCQVIPDWSSSYFGVIHPASERVNSYLKFS